MGFSAFPKSMNPAPIFHRCFTLRALIMACAVVARVHAVDLASESPFAPVSSNADPNATPANSPLQLHGILSTPDGYKFNLCDQAGHVNVWIGLNSTEQPSFVVRSYDGAHHRVTVQYQGRELTLTLEQPKNTPMPMQPPQAMGPPPMMQPGAGAINADEQLRLERLNQEIKRRRALRAAAQQQQPFPPAVNQPPVQPQN
jgi:VCBS repeat-containing protein